MYDSKPNHSYSKTFLLQTGGSMYDGIKRWIPAFAGMTIDTGITIDAGMTQRIFFNSSISKI